MQAHIGLQGNRGPQGIQGPMGIPGLRGAPPDPRDVEIQALKKLVDEQNNKIDSLEQAVETLTEAQNESREQIQALLDYCFTDRSKWKEGQQNKKKDIDEEMEVAKLS